MTALSSAPVTFREAHNSIGLFKRTPVPSGTARATANESHLPPIPGVLEAISEEVSRLNRYGGPVQAATEAIVAEYGRNPNEVLIAAGSSALIQATIGAVCEPGDEVIFSWLSFEGYVAATHAFGAVPVKVPCFHDGQHDVDALLGAITPRTKVIMVSNPNNPSGATLRKEQYDRLVSGVPSHVMLVMDEAYSEFATSPNSFCATTVQEAPDNLVILKTLSKAYGLAGLRLGFALAAPAVVEGISKLRVTNATSNVALAAAVYCFSSSARPFVQERVNYVTSERDRIIHELRERGIPVPDSDGNFVWIPAGVKAVELQKYLIQDRIATKAYANYGTRYTVIDRDINSLFIESLTKWHRTLADSWHGPAQSSLAATKDSV